MTRKDFWINIHTLIGTCDINQRYHQIMASWYSWWDKGAKIAVAVTALVALACVFLPEEWKGVEVGTAILAAVMAVVLNVLPFGEWEKMYDEMFRSWSDLRKDAEVQKVRFCELSEPVEDHVVERLQEMVAKECSLHAMETAPNTKLLEKCQQAYDRSIGLGSKSTSPVSLAAGAAADQVA